MRCAPATAIRRSLLAAERHTPAGAIALLGAALVRVSVPPAEDPGYTMPLAAVLIVTAVVAVVAVTALRILTASLIPSAVRVLDELPLTPNGKADRAAPPGATAPAGAQAPRSRTEAAVARIAADVLGVGSVGVHDDFFALGGHSLPLVWLAAGLRRAFGAELPVAALVTAPTVAAVTRLLVTHPAAYLTSDHLLAAAEYPAYPNEVFFVDAAASGRASAGWTELRLARHELPVDHAEMLDPSTLETLGPLAASLKRTR